MRNKSYILLIIVAITIMTGIIVTNITSAEAAVPVIKQDSLSGTIEINKDRYILVMGKEKLQLALIPPAAMDSLNFHPQTNDTLIVKGVISKGILVCSEAVWQGQSYRFRNAEGEPIWNGKATWTNNPKTCIGCRLCATNCPTNAISMEKNKAVIDQSKCTGCNACIAGNLNKFAGCPVKSITK